MGLFSKNEKVTPPKFDNSYYQPALNASDLVPQAATGYVNGYSKPAVPPKPYGYDDFHQRHSSSSSSYKGNSVYTNGNNINNKHQVIYVPVSVDQQGHQNLNYPMDDERGRRDRFDHVSSSMSPNVGFSNHSRSRSRHSNYRPHSLSHSRYASPHDSSSIYDRNSLSSAFNGINHPLGPEIDFYDRNYNDDQFKVSSRSSSSNLISILSKMRGDEINEDNKYLYRLFRTFDKEYATVEDLRDILADPYYLNYFSYDSVDRILRVFSKSSYGFTFREFINVCIFLKGCYECFAFYDRDGSHHLELDEFTKCLRMNRISCSDNLIIRLFNEGRLNFERYCVAVVTIRTLEKQQR